MTAINVMVQADAVHVITDSAWYDSEGIVFGFAAKAMAIAHWPGVVAVRGPMTGLVLLVAELSIRFRDIDEFAAEAEAFLPDFCERNHRFLTEWGGAADIQVIAAGYSPERGNCRAFVISSASDAHLSRPDDLEDFRGTLTDLDACQMVDMPLNRVAMIPMPSPSAMAATGLDSSNLVVSALDLPAVRRVGTQILTAQRHLSGAIALGSEPMHLIGGFPCFLTVHRDGTVTTSTGKAWPDVIGERIDPTGDPEPEPMPKATSAPYAGLSRQQRRIAARLDRRERKAGLQVI